MGDCVGVRTRIGLGCLGGIGGTHESVELPPGYSMCCPECGELAADLGQCIVTFQDVPPEKERGDGTAPGVVGMVVDCRSCGYYGSGPMRPLVFAIMRRDPEKEQL